MHTGHTTFATLRGQPRKIAELIENVAGNVHPGHRFFTPAEWRARGERYGAEAELVIVHEEGDLAAFFSPEFGTWALQEEMNAALKTLGFYAEPISSWSTAIYPT